MRPEETLEDFSNNPKSPMKTLYGKSLEFLLYVSIWNVYDAVFGKLDLSVPYKMYLKILLFLVILILNYNQIAENLHSVYQPHSEGPIMPPLFSNDHATTLANE